MCPNNFRIPRCYTYLNISLRALPGTSTEIISAIHLFFLGWKNELLKTLRNVSQKKRRMENNLPYIVCTLFS